jgi:XapX domain-containing protein
VRRRKGPQRTGRLMATFTHSGRQRADGQLAGAGCGASAVTASHSKEETIMGTAIVGLVLGLAVGAGCRFFDIPSPAPPRFIGACLLLAMTLGFVVADHILPPGETLVRLVTR